MKTRNHEKDYEQRTLEWAIALVLAVIMLVVFLMPHDTMLRLSASLNGLL